MVLVELAIGGSLLAARAMLRQGQDAASAPESRAPVDALDSQDDDDGGFGTTMWLPLESPPIRAHIYLPHERDATFWLAYVAGVGLALVFYAICRWCTSSAKQSDTVKPAAWSGKQQSDPEWVLLSSPLSSPAKRVIDRWAARQLAKGQAVMVKKGMSTSPIKVRRLRFFS